MERTTWRSGAITGRAISTSEGTPVPSGVAPISFTPYDPNGLDNGPATLADAVPTGSAFDAGLEALIGPESTSGPLPRQPDPAGTQGGLPIRRLSAAPPPPAPQVNASEPISFAPEPVDHRAMSVSLDEPQLGPLAPGANSSPDPSVVTQRQPVGFEGPLPEAVDFASSGSDMLEEPPEAAAVDGDHLDGPPPSIAGLATRPTSVRPAVPAAPDSGLKPFFLEEAGPPRLFGRTPVADVAPAIPSIQMSTTAEPLTSPAPEAASGLPVRSEVKGSPAVPTHLVAPGAPSTGDWGERISPERDLTDSGLTKRSPRQAGDSGRAIPGADAERGVSATRRSPDEVRSLLSRYRDGQQRARAEESVPAGPPEEKETP